MKLHEYTSALKATIETSKTNFTLPPSAVAPKRSCREADGVVGGSKKPRMVFTEIQRRTLVAIFKVVSVMCDSSLRIQCYVILRVIGLSIIVMAFINNKNNILISLLNIKKYYFCCSYVHYYYQ